MRILAICQYYYPEPVRITDMCEELVRRGHAVTILTGVPNYPMGSIYPGYERAQHRNETINGVKVIRCATVPRHTGTIYRFMNYFSYVISASLKVNSLNDEFDVVLVNQQSPVMMAYPGIRYKKKYHKKLLMYCMDLWPASLVAGNIKEGSLLYKVFHMISGNIYKQMNYIFVTSKMFTDYLVKEFGITKQKIEHLPQYAEELFEVKKSEPSSAQRPKETIDFVFAGNVGTAQSIDTIIRAANEVKDDKRIRWHIVGDGKELVRCQLLMQDLKLDSVIFYGRKPLEEMPNYYAMADAMLVTLIADPVLSITLPGKVQTYMAAGKPIIGAADGETPLVIQEAKCGFCAKAEDYKGLAKLVRQFCDSADHEQYSLNSIDYYTKNYIQKDFMVRLELRIKEYA